MPSGASRSLRSWSSSRTACSWSPPSSAARAARSRHSARRTTTASPGTRGRSSAARNQCRCASVCACTPSDAHAAATVATSACSRSPASYQWWASCAACPGWLDSGPAARACANRRCSPMRSPGSRSAATTSVIRPCRSRYPSPLSSTTTTPWATASRIASSSTAAGRSSTSASSWWRSGPTLEAVARTTCCPAGESIAMRLSTTSRRVVGRPRASPPSTARTVSSAMNALPADRCQTSSSRSERPGAHSATSSATTSRGSGRSSIAVTFWWRLSSASATARSGVRPGVSLR